MIGAIVGAVKSATGSSSVVDVAVTLTLPSTGRTDIRVLIKPSKTDILSFTIVISLLASPACSIIGDEADGRTDVLTWAGRRGGREEARILFLEFIVVS